jgi:adenylylsulfate kinase
MSKNTGFFILLTGLSGAGKSSISDGVFEKLKQNSLPVFQLDGDKLRNGLNKDLGFSNKDRSENIRRTAEIGKLLVEANILVLASFIAPFEEDRSKIRNCLGDLRYFEIYVDTPLEICEQRDVKGLYKKVRNGQLKNFTGIDSPYEVPAQYHLKINAGKESLEESIEKVFHFILQLLDKQ